MDDMELIHDNIHQLVQRIYILQLLLHYAPFGVDREENCTSDHEEDISVLEKTISDLEEDGEWKDNYIKKLKEDNQTIIKQALESETELHTHLDAQKKLIKEMEYDIQEMKMKNVEKVVSVKTNETQTNSGEVSHQFTMTEPALPSGKKEL
ncbi:hypothetical protein JTB14_010582 [Gonioctena quinquepunctata]|nr:hypothetical protein JTB14_010582 [Gonioctena quinquepunctata]